MALAACNTGLVLELLDVDLGALGLVVHNLCLCGNLREVLRRSVYFGAINK